MSEDTPDSTGASALSAVGLLAGAPAPERTARLTALSQEARGCVRCPQLVSGRTQVVFGVGNPDAELMLVGEAPGAKEDLEGTPFTGTAARLLDELLDSIGLTREDVFITTVLKCHPPGNRDPTPGEVARCQPYLEEQIALVEPRVVCTLGNFATRLLRDAPEGIKQLHGRVEVVTVGRRAVHLMPLFHPAAALYTRSLLETLRVDVAKLPELLARPAPMQPFVEPEDDEPADDASLDQAGEVATVETIEVLAPPVVDRTVPAVEVGDQPDAEPPVSVDDVERTDETEPPESSQLGLF